MSHLLAALAVVVILLVACGHQTTVHMTRALPVGVGWDVAPTTTTVGPWSIDHHPTTTQRASRDYRRPPTNRQTVGPRSALASWYGEGSRTANGERFDPNGLSFAHRSLPFGTRVTFCHGDRCVTARCNDRGPAPWTGRTFDLSRAAFAALAPLGAGVVSVDWSYA